MGKNVGGFACLLLFFSLASFADCSKKILELGLGSRWDFKNQTVSFRVYSQSATRVDVQLFAKPVSEALLKASLKEDTKTHIWEIEIPFEILKKKGLLHLGLDGKPMSPLYYLYQAWGAETQTNAIEEFTDVDTNGNRFNSQKALLDPYAMAISHDPKTTTQPSEKIYLTGPKHRMENSFKVAPKGIVVEMPEPSQVAKPKRAFKDEVIYELHVRGMSMMAHQVPAKERGTYRGLIRLIPYFKELGITAVELLPTFEFQDDTNQTKTTKANNYWGYDPISFFSGNRRFATNENRNKASGVMQEFREMTDAFHQAGLKVYLDVVYNHTYEGGTQSSDGKRSRMLSWRGLDNSTYYQLADDKNLFQDNTGCGANVNAAHPIVRQMIVDSLKYWSYLGADGFRLDLASVLGNTEVEGSRFNFDKMDSQNVLNRALKEVEGIDLIAEPWGVGPGTYQLGNFPYHPDIAKGWAEWNGNFRDTLRRAENRWGVDGPTPGEVAHILSGSEQIFSPGKKKPWHSVNFVVAHDGFRLMDLVSYNQKNNTQGYPYGPTDGGEDNNLSWDHKIKSESLEKTQSRQRQGARNLMALTLLSFGGVPMFYHGDEILMTQNGNNNLYSVDSMGSWFRWPKDPSKVQDHPFFQFTKRLIEFRKNHASLRPSEYADGTDHDGNGLKDLSWHQADGNLADSRYMNQAKNGFLAWRIDAEELGEKGIRSIYIAYNWSDKPVVLNPPITQKNLQWYWVSDTDEEYEKLANVLEAGKERPLSEFLSKGQYTKEQYKMAGRSIVVLIEK